MFRNGTYKTPHLFTNVYLSDCAVVIKQRGDQARQPPVETAMVINGKESSTLFLGSHQLFTAHRKGFCLLVRCGPCSQLGPWTIFTPHLQVRVIPSTSKVPSLPSQFCSMKAPYRSYVPPSAPHTQEEALLRYCLLGSTAIVSGVRSYLHPWSLHSLSGQCFLVTSVFSNLKTTKPAHGKFAISEYSSCLLMNGVYYYAIMNTLYGN